MGVSLDWLADDEQDWPPILLAPAPEQTGQDSRSVIRAAANVVKGERLQMLHHTAAMLLSAQLAENRISSAQTD